ncbi:MAG TPA: PhzF family phenazine biosynthesis protein [Candidatus Thermoplasmatota archaeon]|nr:PhzF family phenazine biosynthesis protein [Candidatus Thermoplasmatota archaeon]
MGFPLFHVDAFTDKPFGGNPAAVVLMPPGKWPEESWMQSVGMEMNLSETAFVKPDGKGGFSLRWFTPTKEVDLCGHATLASAHVLWQEGVLGGDEEALFMTKSGKLVCKRDGDRIAMEFPDESAKPCEAPPGLFSALGLAPGPILRNRLDYLLVLPDEAAVRALKPLSKAPELQDPVRGFIVTAPSSDPAFDYVCRYFAPAYGIDEDPVTGSIQCALGPYWAQRLGKAELRGRQVSQRGGTFTVRPKGKRVHILGQAVTTVRGDLVAPQI